MSTQASTVSPEDDNDHAEQDSSYLPGRLIQPASGNGDELISIEDEFDEAMPSKSAKPQQSKSSSKRSTKFSNRSPRSPSTQKLSSSKETRTNKETPAEAAEKGKRAPSQSRSSSTTRKSQKEKGASKKSSSRRPRSKSLSVPSSSSDDPVDSHIHPASTFSKLDDLLLQHPTTSPQRHNFYAIKRDDGLGGGRVSPNHAPPSYLPGGMLSSRFSSETFDRLSMSASDLESFVDEVRPDAVHHGPAILSSKKKQRNKMKRSKSLNVPAKQDPPEASSSPKSGKRKSSIRRSASEVGSRSTTKSGRNDKKSKEVASMKQSNKAEAASAANDSKKETTPPKVKRTKSSNNKLKRTKSNRSSNRSKRSSNGNKRKSVVKRRSKSKRSLSSSSSNSSHHSRKSTSSRRSRRKKQKKKKASLPKKRGRKADFFAQAAKQAEYEQVAPGKEEVDKIISNNKVVPVISVPSSLLTVRTKSNYDDRLHQSLLDISNHMSHASLDENSGHVRLIASQSIRNGEAKKRTSSRPFPDNQIVPVDNEAVMRLRIRRLQQSIQDIQLQTQHELAYLLQDTETQKDAMIQLIRDASSPFDALQQMQQSIQHDLAQRGNAWKEEIEWLTKSIKEEQERQQMLLQESSEVSTLTTKVLEEIRLVELNIRLNTAEVQQLSRELQSFTLLSQ